MDVTTAALEAVKKHNLELNMQYLYIKHQIDIGEAKESALQEVCAAMHAMTSEHVQHCLNHQRNTTAVVAGLHKLATANCPSRLRHEQITTDKLRPLSEKVNAAVARALSML
jgi:hypothetical protein